MEKLPYFPYTAVMELLYRHYASILSAKIKMPYVHILFGARQTGKSTLIRSLLPANAKTIDLADPSERARFAAAPGLFAGICKDLQPEKGGIYVFVDEAQTVPSIFDAVQYLYDQDKERYRFILCGSSARRLRTTGANLLPEEASAISCTRSSTMSTLPQQVRRQNFFHGKALSRGSYLGICLG